VSIKPWLLAARPKTLSAAVAPVIVGTALALHDLHGVDWIYALCALFGAVSIQIATNFINDALDFKKGADTHERLGPLRVTQAGLLDAESVLRGGYVALGIAALFGIPLIMHAGWPIVVVGVASILMAYAYTGGPYPLAYHGLGEIFVMIFFGVIAVGGTYFVLTLRYSIEAAACGIAVGSLAVVILAINNLRDIDGDRASNKKTVATRIGERGARGEIVFFVLLAYVGVAFTARWSADPPLLLVLISLPLAVAMLVRVYRSTGRELNRCLAMAGGLQWAFSLLFLIGALR
jgi:1,4-dihydroxy-2-naphthoate polyprenyltransferase